MVVESMLCLSVHFKSQCSPSVIYHERVFINFKLVNTNTFFLSQTVHSHKLCVCAHTAACTCITMTTFPLNNIYIYYYIYIKSSTFYMKCVCITIYHATSKYCFYQFDHQRSSNSDQMKMFVIQNL